MTLARFGLASSLLVLWGCGSGTALLVVADPSAVPGVQQLQISGWTHDGTLLFGPTVRPERADGTLEDEQSLRVLLPDSATESSVEVVVEALVGGQKKGSGRATVVPRRGSEVRVDVQLEALPASCEDCDGCCDDGQCLAPSLGACGAGGVSCAVCDPQRADQCTDSGRCACGTGPACASLLGADRCVDGVCRCGEAAAVCSAGQECENGLCRCTAESCAGCCDGNDCRPGTTDGACGAGGGACVVCVLPQQCAAGACG